MAGDDSGNSGTAVDSSCRETRMMYTGISCFADGIMSSGDGNGVVGATHTYKRRKRGANSEPKLAQIQRDKKVLEEVVAIGLQKQYYALNKTDSYTQHKQSTLHSLLQSFGADQGAVSWIEDYIKVSLCSDGKTDHANVSAVHEGQHGTHQASMPTRSINNVETHSVFTSKGALPGPNNLSVTKQCQRAVIRLLMSDKITSLCTLFSDNFYGVKPGKILDFTMLISRMEDGAYEQSPALFASDIQEAWGKLHAIGTEMISLAKSLSDLSRLFCGESGGSMDHGISDDKNKEIPWFSDGANGREQPNDSVRKACACRQCKENSDGSDCLVCDSCEEMYHVSCIVPPVKEIPDGNWYCAKCIVLGIDSPHENCAVCEKLSFPAGACDCDSERIERTPVQLEETICSIIENGIEVYKGGDMLFCKVCKSTLARGELFRPCEHNECDHHYHLRCLTDRQLKSYCSKWYCPCCLCRGCLTDKDDDKIVLCDACDDAYHVYCMSPPRKSIPEGQWYCSKCVAGLQAIYKAKSSYKSVEEDKQKEVKDRKVSPGRKPAEAVSKLVDTSGAMDIFSSAANTISKQEQLNSVITGGER